MNNVFIETELEIYNHQIRLIARCKKITAIKEDNNFYKFSITMIQMFISELVGGIRGFVSGLSIYMNRPIDIFIFSTIQKTNIGKI